MAAAALALLLAAGEAPPGCAVLDPGLAGIGSHAWDLARTAELAGFLPLRPQLFLRPSSERPLALCPGGSPAGAQAEAKDDGAGWSLVPPSSFSTLHTAWSDDRNDGALFGGRGLSSELSAGVRFRWRWLTAQVAPLAAWQQNRSFPAPAAAFAGQSPYANPYNYSDIDLPLRMGPKAFSTLDLGQSFVRADAFGLAAGLSTENLWWGPGVRNSLLMSNSAAGFPHLFLGTARPADIWIGRLEAQLLWGHLAESRWFDFDPSNDTRLFEGFTLGFEPALAPGLFLGYARVFLFPSTNVSVHHYFDPIVQPLFKVFLTSKSNPEGQSTDNQLLSVFFRWAFPPVGFEVYGEYARDDHAFNTNDFLMEPAHSLAWLLGLGKVFTAGCRWVRLQLEAAHTFELPANNPTRPVPIFYTHFAERQGYTQRGQMLGAGIGPQADSQFLALDVFGGAGRWGGYLERLIRNERWFYDQILPAGGHRHDLAMSYGARGAWSWRAFDLEWDLAFAHRYAPDFGPARSGLDGRLALRWWPERTAVPALPAPPAPRAP